MKYSLAELVILYVVSGIIGYSVGHILPFPETPAGAIVYALLAVVIIFMLVVLWNILFATVIVPWIRGE